MLDSYLVAKIEKLIIYPAKICVRLKISANSITALGLVIVVPLFFCLALGAWGWALFFLILNRIADGLDGAVARYKKSVDSKTKVKDNLQLMGAYFDIVADYVFYSSVPLGFAVHSYNNALPAAFLLCSFVFTAVTFLAFSMQAEKAGIVNKKFKQKGFYYFSGMVEGAETIAFFVFIILFPSYFVISAYIFAGCCFITAGFRFISGIRMLKRV